MNLNGRNTLRGRVVSAAFLALTLGGRALAQGRR
jgi:hypothetical protein